METEEEFGNAPFVSKSTKNNISLFFQKVKSVNLQSLIYPVLNFLLIILNHFYRKPAAFEGLEIDQYIWSVLQNKQTVEFDEVTVDQNAKVKPCLPTVVKVKT